MPPFFTFPQPSSSAIFLRRPQRFLAEVRLPDGSTVLAYCPNPGSFAGCLKEGSAVLLWESSDACRKRKFTLRAIKCSRTWIGTDTHFANRLAEKALSEGLLPEFRSAELVQREPTIRTGCRFDFLLRDARGDIFVEVKSAMVAERGTAQFPDSLSPRATAHLRELSKLAKAGHRACLLFEIQRGDVQQMTINRDRDPVFTRAFSRAVAAGVQVMALKHVVTKSGFGPPVAVPLQR